MRYADRKMLHDYATRHDRLRPGHRKNDYRGLACDYVKLAAVVSVALLALWLIWSL